MANRFMTMQEFEEAIGEAIALAQPRLLSVMPHANDPVFVVSGEMCPMCGGPATLTSGGMWQCANCRQAWLPA